MGQPFFATKTKYQGLRGPTLQRFITYSGRSSWPDAIFVLAVNMNIFITQ